MTVELKILKNAFVSIFLESSVTFCHWKKKILRKSDLLHGAGKK